MLRIHLNFIKLHKLCGQLLVLQDSPALKFSDVSMEPSACISITTNSILCCFVLLNRYLLCATWYHIVFFLFKTNLSPNVKAPKITKKTDNPINNKQ